MISIHKAYLADLEGLVPLFDAYLVFYQKPSDVQRVREFLEKRIQREESEIFIARDESENYIGFVQLYPLFSSTRMKPLWLLNDLFVDPAFRGKGISKMLIEKAKELVRLTGAAGLSLETKKSNAIANQLYLATGFELDTYHNFYFWTTQ